MGEDFIAFQNFQVYAKFMVTESEVDFGGQKFDGVMGLNNDHKFKNIFQIAYQAELLTSPVFGFKLGLRYLN